MPYVEYDEVEAICPDCGAPFRSEEARDAHARDVHGAAGPQREPARPVRCAVCGTTVRSVTALQQHNRRAHVAGAPGSARPR